MMPGPSVFKGSPSGSSIMTANVSRKRLGLSKQLNSVGRSVEVMPNSLKSVKLRNRLNMLSPDRRSPKGDEEEFDEELASLKKELLKVEHNLNIEQRTS